MESEEKFQHWFLPNLPIDLIRACYDAAAGSEFTSGKFGSPESSAALVANAFGFFLNSPELLPTLPMTEALGWPASYVKLETCLRFPWSGGRHPYLDVVVATDRTLIGIESKRFEPFRSPHEVDLSEAYWRKVWGENMTRFGAVRDLLKTGELRYRHLDACQLVKHAFGLRTEVHRASAAGKLPQLVYLYSTPSRWPDGRTIPESDHRRHLEEVKDFTIRVAGDEVAFSACSYGELLVSWHKRGGSLAAHAEAVVAHFAPASLDALIVDA